MSTSEESSCSVIFNSSTSSDASVDLSSSESESDTLSPPESRIGLLVVLFRCLSPFCCQRSVWRSLSDWITNDGSRYSHLCIPFESSRQMFYAVDKLKGAHRAVVHLNSFKLHFSMRRLVTLYLLLFRFQWAWNRMQPIRLRTGRVHPRAKDGWGSKNFHSGWQWKVSLCELSSFRRLQFEVHG